MTQKADEIDNFEKIVGVWKRFVANEPTDTSESAPNEAYGSEARFYWNGRDTEKAAVSKGEEGGSEATGGKSTRYSNMGSVERNAGVAPDSSTLSQTDNPTHVNGTARGSPDEDDLIVTEIDKVKEECSEKAETRKYEGGDKRQDASGNKFANTSVPASLQESTTAITSEGGNNVTNEVVANLERALALQEAKMENLREALYKKSKDYRLLLAEVVRLRRPRVPFAEQSIGRCARRALDMISDMKIIVVKTTEEQRSNPNTDELSRLQLENQNLKNVINELIEKIKELKEKLQSE